MRWVLIYMLFMYKDMEAQMELICSKMAPAFTLPPWSASWEICMQVRKHQLELDMEQQTGSKWEKEFVKAFLP